MGENVWQLFVQVVGKALSLFASLNSQKNQSSGGASPNALVNDAGSTLTSTSATSQEQKNTLRIQRNPSLTTDAHFGAMDFNGERICFTMENRALAIPEGIYSLEITYSPDFGREMPLLDGTSPRTEIRIHPANWPTQLKGCVAVGQSIDGDSLSNSELAFEKVFGIIQKGIASGGISIQISNSIS